MGVVLEHPEDGRCITAADELAQRRIMKRRAVATAPELGST